MFSAILSWFKRKSSIMQRCNSARAAGQKAFEEGLSQDSNPVHIIDPMTDMEWRYWDDGWLHGEFLQSMKEHHRTTDDLLKQLQIAVENWKGSQ